MKNILRVPSPEKYAYTEHEFEGSAEDAIAEHKRLTHIATGGTGLEQKEFNRVLDELMTKNSINGDPGMMENMNLDQVAVVQAIKRSRARIAAKEL